MEHFHYFCKSKTETLDQNFITSSEMGHLINVLLSGNSFVNPLIIADKKYYKNTIKTEIATYISGGVPPQGPS